VGKELAISLIPSSAVLKSTRILAVTFARTARVTFFNAGRVRGVSMQLLILCVRFAWTRSSLCLNVLLTSRFNMLEPEASPSLATMRLKFTVRMNQSLNATRAQVPSVLSKGQRMVHWQQQNISISSDIYRTANTLY
jgi:hypothetical protein